ncbi:MAG: hypothetical protein PHN45_02580 [Methylococcales bacterium]|nr:hypothetical protein [Methylococcales bacterium]MDD5753616.1 hypothetical protein [Methylococcales bacterium]
MTSLSFQSLAQQNLFNVPSSDITETGKMFFQQQFNLSNLSGVSNTTFDYGLENDLEIGINIFNVEMYPTGELQNPHVLANFQKGFTINEYYKIGFGTQTGITPPIYNKTIDIPSFSYFNNAVNLGEYGKYNLGVYHANHAYAGEGDSFGLMAGFDYPLIENKLDFQGDILTGNNDISVAVLGFVIFLPKEWQLSFGAQLPSPTSNNDYGAVFEITKL